MLQVQVLEVNMILILASVLNELLQEAVIAKAVPDEAVNLLLIEKMTRDSLVLCHLCVSSFLVLYLFQHWKQSLDEFHESILVSLHAHALRRQWSVFL